MLQYVGEQQLLHSDWPHLYEIHGCKPDKVLMSRQLSDERLQCHLLIVEVEFYGCLCTALVVCTMEAIAGIKEQSLSPIQYSTIQLDIYNALYVLVKPCSKVLTMLK